MSARVPKPPGTMIDLRCGTAESGSAATSVTCFVSSGTAAVTATKRTR